MTAQEAFGQMVKERRWRVSPDRPTGAVAEDFVATVRDHALPAMQKQMRAP